MLATLKSRGESFFRAKGILQMLERNVKIKDVPERWQEHKNVAKFEVVVCFEERVFDILLEDLHCRTAQGFRSVHVVNIDTDVSTCVPDFNWWSTLLLRVVPPA